jgi:hypothetical protein
VSGAPAGGGGGAAEVLAEATTDHRKAPKSATARYRDPRPIVVSEPARSAAFYGTINAM